MCLVVVRVCLCACLCSVTGRECARAHASLAAYPYPALTCFVSGETYGSMSIHWYSSSPRSESSSRCAHARCVCGDSTPGSTARLRAWHAYARTRSTTQQPARRGKTTTKTGGPARRTRPRCAPQSSPRPPPTWERASSLLSLRKAVALATVKRLLFLLAWQPLDIPLCTNRCKCRRLRERRAFSACWRLSRARRASGFPALRRLS